MTDVRRTSEMFEIMYRAGLAVELGIGCSSGRTQSTVGDGDSLFPDLHVTKSLLRTSKSVSTPCVCANKELCNAERLTQKCISSALALNLRIFTLDFIPEFQGHL